MNAATAPYPWQMTQWQQVQQRHQQGRLPHALLLTGPKGLGKLDFAVNLAHSLLCTQRQTQGLACGNCRQCLLLRVNNHPDYHLIQAESNSRSIKIEQIRSLDTITVETSTLSLCKVVIIAPAEAMTTASSNALLKSLEEPGLPLYFLLVSHEPQALLKTLVSRCQRIVFAMRGDKQALDWLQTTQTLDEKTAKQLLQWSHGAPLLAATMANETTQQARGDFACDWLALQKGTLHAIYFSEKWHKYDILQLIEWMLTSVTELIYASTTAVPVSWLTIYALYDNLLNSKRLLSQSNAINAQLLLEDLCLQIAQRFPLTFAMGDS